MTTANTLAGVPSQLKFELYKGRKQLFYKLLLLGPFLFGLILALIQQVLRIADPLPPGLSLTVAQGTHDLGTNGAFAYASNIILADFGAIFTILTVIAAAFSVANEYRWNTIKMLAIREPNRATLVLGKVIFALVLVAGIAISTIVGWFLYAMSVKTYYGVSLEITSEDWSNIGKGLVYLIVICLQTYILALFAIFLSYWFKSIVAGIIGYFAFTGLESILSQVATVINNNGYGASPNYIRPFLALLKFLNPIFLTTNVNRLTMVKKYVPQDSYVTNPFFPIGIAVWWSWLVLALYIGFFIALSMLIFVRRDINE